MTIVADVVHQVQPAVDAMRSGLEGERFLFGFMRDLMENPQRHGVPYM